MMSEPKIGQLCWFWNNWETGCGAFGEKRLGRFRLFCNGFYYKKSSPVCWKYCEPLTKEEIKQFMEMCDE